MVEVEAGRGGGKRPPVVVVVGRRPPEVDARRRYYYFGVGGPVEVKRWRHVGDSEGTEVWSIRAGEGAMVELYRLEAKERRRPAPRPRCGSLAGSASSPRPADEGPTGDANARRFGDGDLIW